jgi:hypothetical protein
VDGVGLPPQLVLDKEAGGVVILCLDEFLDLMAKVPRHKDKLIDDQRRETIENVRKHRFASDIDEWFGLAKGVWTKACPKSGGQDYHFHGKALPVRPKDARLGIWRTAAVWCFPAFARYGYEKAAFCLATGSLPSPSNPTWH